jgi:hypothetical protein
VLATRVSYISVGIPVAFSIILHGRISDDQVHFHELLIASKSASTVAEAAA